MSERIGYLFIIAVKNNCRLSKEKQRTIYSTKIAQLKKSDQIYPHIYINYIKFSWRKTSTDTKENFDV